MAELERLHEREQDYLDKMAALQSKLDWAIQKSSGRAKSSTDRNRGKRPSDLEGQDAANYSAYMPLFIQIYHFNKILPQGWSNYSEDERSLCARLMRPITVPYGYTEKEYWENMMAAQITYKIRNMKCNYQKAMRETSEGRSSMHLFA
jgi:hypothetical protein